MTTKTTKFRVPVENDGFTIILPDRQDGPAGTAPMCMVGMYVLAECVFTFEPGDYVFQEFMDGEECAESRVFDSNGEEVMSIDRDELDDMVKEHLIEIIE